MTRNHLRLPHLGNVLWPKNGRQVYGRSGTLVVRKFFNVDQVDCIMRGVASLPRRRASVPDNRSISWESRDVPENHWISRAVGTRTMRSAIRKTVGLPWMRVLRTLSWTHHYEVNEFIPEHLDRNGTIQLVACLRCRPEENEEVFYIRQHGEKRHITMKAGDAMLFDATRLAHGTEPLAGEMEHGGADRVVLVVRYYQIGCGESVVSVVGSALGSVVRWVKRGRGARRRARGHLDNTARAH